MKKLMMFFLLSFSAINGFAADILLTAENIPTMLNHSIFWIVYGFEENSIRNLSGSKISIKMDVESATISAVCNKKILHHLHAGKPGFCELQNGEVIFWWNATYPPVDADGTLFITSK